MTPSPTFASDTASGVHPNVIKAMMSVNVGYAEPYGLDTHTQSVIRKFKRHFGRDVDVYLVFGGTGANVLSLVSLTEGGEAIICAETAHINVDECGAPERFTGCKLLTIPTTDGKITAQQVQRYLRNTGDQHHAQPKVISITQPTELGTVYRTKEIAALARCAHRNSMYLHVDGARLANAAASLKVSFKRITSDAGVDVVSFGGTKNGAMYGEAVIFFDKRLSKRFKYIRKRGAQLPSKMRFISAQFEALLSDGIWRENASHANRMAQHLARGLARNLHLRITQRVETNAVFVIVPKKYISILQKEYMFYVWNEETCEVRLMTSFNTTEEDVDGFLEFIKKKYGKR